MKKRYYAVNNYSRVGVGPINPEVWLYPVWNSSFPSGCENSVEFARETVAEIQGAHVTIMAYGLKHEDILKIPLAANVFKRAGVAKLSLEIPYFPYARMDRQMHGGAPLSLKVMAGIINSCGFDEVIVFDPHSTVTEALVDNLVIFDPVTPTTAFGVPHITVIAPDAGASLRASRMVKNLRDKNPTHDVVMVQATKQRNDTGVRVSVPALEETRTNVFVVDDICDGGATYAELKKAITDAGSSQWVISWSLVVTHGLFTTGAMANLAGYDHIYSSSSFPQPDWSRSARPIFWPLGVKQRDY